MNTAAIDKANYLAAACKAGYLDDSDDILYVKDQGEFFHHICYNSNEGNLLVSRFHKEAGEYSAQPELETDSFLECVLLIENYTK
jgi:hypothetical protein